MKVRGGEYIRGPRRGRIRGTGHFMAPAATLNGTGTVTLPPPSARIEWWESFDGRRLGIVVDVSDTTHIIGFARDRQTEDDVLLDAIEYLRPNTD